MDLNPLHCLTKLSMREDWTHHNQQQKSRLCIFAIHSSLEDATKLLNMFIGLFFKTSTAHGFAPKRPRRRIQKEIKMTPGIQRPFGGSALTSDLHFSRQVDPAIHAYAPPWHRARPCIKQTRCAVVNALVLKAASDGAP